MQHSIFFYVFIILLRFWLAGAVSTVEEKHNRVARLMNEGITMVFVEQPLALSGSANN